jgi:hypothetical protein
VTTEGDRQAGKTAVIGGAIAIYTFFDAILVGMPILLLAAWLNALIVFVVALVVVTLLDLAACGWVDRQWDVWVAGTRFEARMQKVRDGKRARRPVKWISNGSDAWFGLAAAMLNAVQVIALARLLTGRPVGSRRIFIASVAWALFMAGVFSLFGVALRDVIRAM